MSYDTLYEAREQADFFAEAQSVISGIQYGMECVDTFLRMAKHTRESGEITAVHARVNYNYIEQTLRSLKLECDTTQFSFEEGTVTADLQYKTEGAFLDAVKRIWQAIVDSVNWLIEKISDFLGFSRKKSEQAEVRFKEVKEKTEKVIKATKSVSKALDWNAIEVDDHLLCQHFAFMGKSVKLADLCEMSSDLDKTMTFLIGLFDALTDAQTKTTNFVIDFATKMDEVWGEVHSDFRTAVSDLVGTSLHNQIQKLPEVAEKARITKLISEQSGYEEKLIVQPSLRMAIGFVDGNTLVFFRIQNDGEEYQQVRKLKALNPEATDCVIKVDSVRSLERLVENLEANVKTLNRLTESSDTELKTIREQAKKMNRVLLSAIQRNKEQDFYENMRSDFKVIHTLIATMKLTVTNASSAIGMAILTTNEFNLVLERSSKAVTTALNR